MCPWSHFLGKHVFHTPMSESGESPNQQIQNVLGFYIPADGKNKQIINPKVFGMSLCTLNIQLVVNVSSVL